MRNTQNLSIIRSEPPPAIGDETTGLCRALPWALFRGCWRWVFPSFSMAVIHSSFSSTRPFFLALMPVAVVVGIALHSLLNGKLLYSVSATILTVGLMFALLFLWLLG